LEPRPGIQSESDVAGGRLYGRSVARLNYEEDSATKTDIGIDEEERERAWIKGHQYDCWQLSDDSPLREPRLLVASVPRAKFARYAF
jgi:hypothetical protein